MLSIQPLNLATHYSFRGTRMDESDYAYTKEQYEDDKSKLEEHMEELNEVIENTKMPKPIRVMGKIASIGIGAGLGFVSMKFGAQGVAKLGKQSINYLKQFGEKEGVKNILSHFKEIGQTLKNGTTTLFNKVSKFAENNKFLQNIFGKVSELVSKLKNTKCANKVNEITNKIADSKLGKSTTELFEKTKTKVKGITSENVEKAVVNTFAVSGGVTGGITALQQATKGQADDTTY